MTSHIQNNTENDDAPDESSYVASHPSCRRTDFSEYLNESYSNISMMYESPSGPMVLYTAVRYGKRYILKGLKEDYRNDPVYNLVLRKEFEIGISIDQPCIRRTVGFEEIPGIGRVIVLEYIDGITLDKAIKEGRINTSNAHRVASQLAAALSYLHSRQIIHRDLKPGNILITYTGNDVKLIDMSLADSESYLILKDPAGTKNYMAPELFEPQARPSVTSDIYSFGLIVKRLATIGNDPQLRKIAEQCMVENPAKRPQSLSTLRIPTEPYTSVSNSLFNIDSPRLTKLLVIMAGALAALTLFLAHTRGMI